MTLFKEEDYGRVINKELKSILVDYTTQEDIGEANRISGVSLSSITHVSRGANSLTDKNSKGLIALASIAYLNAVEAEQKAKEAQKLLKPFHIAQIEVNEAQEVK